MRRRTFAVAILAAGLAAAPLTAAALQPVYQIPLDVTEKALVAGAKVIPGGWVAVGFDKVLDLSAKLGKAGLEREDETRGAEMVIANRDAALLKSLTDNGVDIEHNAAAQAARARLSMIGGDLNSHDLSATDYLLAMTRKHLLYAVGKVAADAATDLAFDKLMDVTGVAADLKDATSPARGMAHWVDGRHQYAILKGLGWTQFAVRADAAHAFAQEFAEKLVNYTAGSSLDEIANGIFNSMVSDAREDVLADLSKRWEAEHPPGPPTPEWVRLAVPQMEAARPAEMMMAPAPEQAAPAPAAAAAPAEAAEPTQVDPVQLAIVSEDHSVYMAAHRSPSMSAAPAPAAQSQPEEMPRWRQEYRAALGLGCYALPSCHEANFDGR
jgi:hypothetical protein